MLGSTLHFAAFENLMRDVDHATARILCTPTEVSEGVCFAHGLGSHEDALGSFDVLSVLEGEFEVFDLGLEIAELFESAPCDDNGRFEIFGDDGLDEVGHDVITHGFFDEFEGSCCGRDDGGEGVCIAEFDGGVDAFAVGVHNSGDEDVGSCGEDCLFDLGDGATGCDDPVLVVDGGDNCVSGFVACVRDDDGVLVVGHRGVVSAGLDLPSVDHGVSQPSVEWSGLGRRPAFVEGLSVQRTGLGSPRVLRARHFFKGSA